MKNKNSIKKTVTISLFTLVTAGNLFLGVATAGNYVKVNDMQEKVIAQQNKINKNQKEFNQAALVEIATVRDNQANTVDVTTKALDQMKVLIHEEQQSK